MTEKRQIGSVEQMEEQAHQQWRTVGGTTTRKPLSAQHPGSSDTQVPGPRLPGNQNGNGKRSISTLTSIRGYGTMQQTPTRRSAT